MVYKFHYGNLANWVRCWFWIVRIHMLYKCDEKRDEKNEKKMLEQQQCNLNLYFFSPVQWMMMAKYLMIRLCGSSTDYHHHHTKEYLGIFFLRSYWCDVVGIVTVFHRLKREIGNYNRFHVFQTIMIRLKKILDYY